MNIENFLKEYFVFFYLFIVRRLLWSSALCCVSQGIDNKVLVDENSFDLKDSKSYRVFFKRFELADGGFDKNEGGLLRFFVKIRRSDFPLLSPSPWPFFAAWSAFVFVVGVASFFNFYENAIWCVCVGFVSLGFVFKVWVRDYVRELTWLTRRTRLYVDNLSTGFILFIVSEMMLFFCFFWGFFHSSIEPSIQVGNIWPLIEGLPVEDLTIPSWNTAILLISGVALTWAQYSLFMANSAVLHRAFFIVFICAGFFLANQHTEYAISFVQINDAVFGSTLYMLTSFHGFHVIIGTIFLFVVFLRFCITAQLYPRYAKELVLAAWYWHFVDVIWIYVYFFVYLWNLWVGSYVGGFDIFAANSAYESMQNLTRTVAFDE